MSQYRQERAARPLLEQKLVRRRISFIGRFAGYVFLREDLARLAIDVVGHAAVPPPLVGTSAVVRFSAGRGRRGLAVFRVRPVWHGHRRDVVSVHSRDA